MNIINRIQSDGFFNLIVIVIKKIKNLIYRRVNTFLFEFSLSEDCNSNITDALAAHCEFKVLCPNEHLFYLSVAQINSYQEMGGVCVTLHVERELVGYIWYFSRQYQVDGVGIVDLVSQNAIWVGPVFIHKNHRGNGYNKALLSEVIKNYSNNVKILMTSINSENTSSIRSFEAFGFKRVKSIESVYKFGKLELTSGALN